MRTCGVDRERGGLVYRRKVFAMTQDINWTISRDDAKSISRIVKRTHKEHPDVFDTMGLTMDLTACHLNGCSLDLADLVKAESSDFIHDVDGISRHINRDTGELGACFLPRYARKAGVPA